MERDCVLGGLLHSVSRTMQFGSLEPGVYLELSRASVSEVLRTAAEHTLMQFPFPVVALDCEVGELLGLEQPVCRVVSEGHDTGQQ